MGPVSLSSPLSPSLTLTADIISTVQFNHDGEFLATGDKGGRVVIFQRDGTKMRVSRTTWGDGGGGGGVGACV